MVIENAQPGQIITFGRYPQTAAGTDLTTIKWLVLENSGRELFLLSKYLLDCRRYHHQFIETSWRDCDLRRWLNSEFYSSSFSDDERKFVKSTHNKENGEDSPDTEDKVFLLSIAEVNRLTDKLGKDFRRTRGAAYAQIRKPDGCELYVMDKNVAADYITENGKTYGCSWWWLRNRGKLKDEGNDYSRAAFIGTRASIRHYARVDLGGYGVRPAIKLHLTK